MSPGKHLLIAGLFGLTGVLLGAFGAHALHATLVARQTAAIWETAVTYQLVHSVALLAVAGWGADTGVRPPGLTAAVWCWVAGILFFSGSLYALALGAPRVVGPVTPIGGLLLLAGWVLVMVAGGRAARKPPAG